MVFATSLARGTSEIGINSEATTSVCSTALRNTSDDLSQLDLAVRHFEQPRAATFSESRVAALLLGANRQLREARPGIQVSAALMTTWFGSLMLAQAGQAVSLHRLRQGEAQLLTTHDPAWRPSPLASRGEAGSPCALGHSDELALMERREPLEEGDVFILSNWIVGGDGRSKDISIFEEMASAPSFDVALGICFRSLPQRSDLPVLLAHCV